MIDIESLKNAIALTQAQKFEEAEKIYTELIQSNPQESALLSAFGLFYVNINNYDKAVFYLKRACEIKKTLGTVAALGLAEYERKNFEEAALILEQALEYGENIDIYNKLVLSLFEIKKYDKALYYTDKMNELYPDKSKSVANKVKALTQTGKLIEAERICVEYLKKHTDDSSLWFHLGLLKELIYSDDKQAIECYKLAGENGNISADYNIAVAYQKLGEFEEAEKYYKKFLERFPDEETAIISLGMCYLTQKRFKEGYDLLYKRSFKKNCRYLNKYVNNLWVPNTKLKKDLTIVCDQGYGDQIQFIRYLPFLKEHNIRVACTEPLSSLFKINYPNVDFINIEDINPKIQQLRITDLAYVLNMDFDNIPFSEGYLDIQSDNIKSNKTKIGLCWEAGAAGTRGMINRTINVKCFEQLLNLDNLEIYSFQYNDTFNGNEKYPQMINLAKNFKDFSDTAKALKSMDYVVTVDTAVAHLSGALGVKTYLLLPYAPDWRWFRGKYTDDTYTPWYDSIQIFMQKDCISWEEPINRVIKSLS